jgi:GH24 family phage-related lysozyme (muramidase)
LTWQLIACTTTPKFYPDSFTPGIFRDAVSSGDVAHGTLRPIDEAGWSLTKRSEGFKAKLYLDAAKYCSIAYGHLVKRAPCDGGEPPEFLHGITEQRGGELLVSDMALAQYAVGNAVHLTLSDAQFSALCDFVYNVGGDNFRHSTLLRVINQGALGRVAPELRRWVYAGGAYYQALRDRREREIQLFYVGVQAVAPQANDTVMQPIDILVGEN